MTVRAKKQKRISFDDGIARLMVSSPTTLLLTVIFTISKHTPIYPQIEFYERFAGRQALLEFAAKSGIPVAQTTAKPWSTDENLFHISYEAGILEDPDVTPPSDMWKLTKSIEEAPSTPERIALHFKEGIPSKLELFGEADSTSSSSSSSSATSTVTDPVDIFFTLNKLARKHGIGRIDIVENRFIGVKSRGCYESPGATILRKAHMDLEGLVLDRNVRALRDGFVTTELSKILYNGYWFSPEREFVQSCLAASQKVVNGIVRLALLKGNVIVEGRSSQTAVRNLHLLEGFHEGPSLLH